MVAMNNKLFVDNTKGYDLLSIRYNYCDTTVIMYPKEISKLFI